MPIRRTSNQSSQDTGFYNPEVYSDVGGGVFEFDADALTYINAVEAADGEALEFNVKTAYNAFVVGCKSDGIWSAIQASCILAGARTLSGALTPLVGVAPSGFNFVAADYDRKTGLLGNGSTKYLSQQTVSPLQNNAHQSVYTTSSPTTTAPNYETLIAQGPTTGSAGRTQISVNTTQTFSRCREATGNVINLSSSFFRGISRSNSSNYSRRLNGSTSTITQSSTGVPNTTLIVFNNPGLNQYVSCRIPFYSSGESLNLSLLDNRVTVLMSGIQNAIP